MMFDTSLASRVWLLALLLSVVATGSGSAPASAAEPGKFWVFVGTYTDGKSKGIYRMTLDTASGRLSEPALAAAIDNPSFLAIHPTRKFLLHGQRESPATSPARSLRSPSTPKPES